MAFSFRRRVLALLPLALVIGLSSAISVHAQSKIPYSQTQAGMNEAAGKDFAQADAEMNRAYKKLITALKPKQQKNLRESQRQWLKFRDAETKFRSSEFEGGSAYPMVYSGHMAGLTRHRTKELTETHKNFNDAGMM
jgi:uncharacterized protein YecT (DUF1311 family)